MSDWNRKVSVQLPEDIDGFLQRSCQHCGLLFAVHVADYSNARVINLRCPRCQFVEPFDSFTTQLQRDFAEAHAQDALNQMAEEALEQMTRSLFDGLKSSKHIKVTGPTGRISLPGTPVPIAIAPVSMSSEQCGACGLRFKTSEVGATACPVCR
jgi:hypothetical protein